jgi:hypothetical protein
LANFFSCCFVPLLDSRIMSFASTSYTAGYNWQNEKKESKWCATYDYTSRPCYYRSTVERGCKSNHLYLAECNDNDVRQRFQVHQVGINTDDDKKNALRMIRVPQKDRCWTRNQNKSLVELRPCNAESPKQQWIVDGSSKKRFELVPVTEPSDCGTYHTSSSVVFVLVLLCSGELLIFPFVQKKKNLSDATPPSQRWRSAGTVPLQGGPVT